MRSNSYENVLKSKYKGLELHLFSSNEEGLEEVRNGRLYGFIGTLDSLGYTITQEHIYDLKIAGKLNEYVPFTIAVSNKEPLLYSIIAKLLNTISADKLRTIQTEQNRVRYEQMTDYSLIWKILTVSTLIVLILIYRQRIISRHNAKLQSMNEALKHLSQTDKLTNLYNRLKLDELLQIEIARSNRYGTPLSLIMIDIDFFKSINDTFGHQIGDLALIQTAKTLQENLRSSDAIGRWGGEEFLVIVPQTEFDDAIKLAEKLRISIEFSDFKGARKLTISLGVTSLRFLENENLCLKRVDDALYLAKENGRNRVEGIE